MGDDLLFDYMFLKVQDKEEENERLREENDELIERMDSRRNDIFDNEDIDEARFFAEDFQSIAASCWIDVEISYEEAERAIRQWYTPEGYYEYKVRS